MPGLPIKHDRMSTFVFLDSLPNHTQVTVKGQTKVKSHKDNENGRMAVVRDNEHNFGVWKANG